MAERFVHMDQSEWIKHKIKGEPIEHGKTDFLCKWVPTKEVKIEKNT